MLHSRLSLETKIQKIKAEIMALGLELQPGLLTQQYNVCGSPGCRCKADPPQKHGPYYQLSFTRKGKSRTQFVRRHDLSLVEEQVRNYQLLKKLTDRWVALGMALSRLRLTRTPPYRCGRPFEMERGHVQLSALFRSVAAFLPDGRHESVVGWGFNFAGATRLFGCRPP